MTINSYEFYEDSPFAGLVEINPLRTQALDLFDHCLANGDSSAVAAFIERQLSMNTPDLQLLQEIADDLQHRLFTLRANQFETREIVVQAFECFGVDITPVAPAGALDHYHQLEAAQLLACANRRGEGAISAEDVRALTHMTYESLKNARRLHLDIQLTSELHKMIIDWFDAISATLGRRYWNERDIMDFYQQ